MEKKLYYLLPVLVCCFTACKQSVKSTKIAADTTVTSGKSPESRPFDTLDYIDWDSVKINGIAHTISSKNLLYSLLGKPDSVVTPDMNDVCGTFFDNTFKFVYIKGAKFELRGDSIVLSTMNFKVSGLMLVARNITLDNNTTLASLSKIFPAAVKKQYEVTVERNEKRTAIMLGLNKKYIQGDSDDVWVLLFKNGKLIEIDHYIAC